MTKQLIGFRLLHINTAKNEKKELKGNSIYRTTQNNKRDELAHIKVKLNTLKLKCIKTLKYWN